jgi:hypothetical protein
MITTTDRDVDEIYRRGVAELVEHAQQSAVVTKPQRVRFVAAIVGLGVPLAALAAGAIVVIVDHAKPAPAPNPPSTTGHVKLVLGQTFRVTDSQGLVASVTVEKAPVDTQGDFTETPAPKNGAYVGVQVLLTLPAAIDNSAATSTEFVDEQATLDNQLALLATMRIDGDVVRSQAELFAIAHTQVVLSQLVRQLLPFTFTYLATNGHGYPDFNGNALQSGFAPLLIPTSPLPKGLTYGDIVFDVPSTGGVIQMTDPFNSAVATWTSS